MPRHRSFAVSAAGLAAVFALTGCQLTLPATPEEPSQSEPAESQPTEPEASTIEVRPLPDETRAPTGEWGAMADAVPTDIAAGGVLQAATPSALPLIAYVPEGGDEARGLAVDLAAEYAHRLGLELELTPDSGIELVEGVEDGTHDLALTMIDAAPMQQRVDIVDYAMHGSLLVESASAPTSVASAEELCGLAVVGSIETVERQALADVSDSCEARGQEPVDIVPSMAMPQQETLSMLQTGDADIVWAPDTATVQALQDSDDYSVVGEHLPFTMRGVAVTQTEPGLSDAVQLALQSMIDDGTYQEILDRWSLGFLAVDEITINGSEYAPLA